ncbi:MAG: patatin-like phospholipase family protein [Thermoleophilaceae bacterium]
MDPKQLPPCDLVMKGGITSGVVYPGAVAALAERYRFRRVGGSSAGAIAAAVCAAAEYGRQTGRGPGMRVLTEIAQRLGEPGFLLGLFQPAPGARPLWEVAMALAERRAAEPGAHTRRLALRAARMALTRRRKPLRPAGLALIALAVALAGFGAAGALNPLATVLLVLLGLVVVAALAAVAAVRALLELGREALAALPDSDYGLCPGSRQPGGSGQALVEWLHERIQEAAGRTTDDPPLTFADLEDEGIGLAMTTTDLSYAAPVSVPLPARTYMFHPDEMRERFPGSVVEQMMGSQEGPYPWMPDRDLPVVVGVRLSLSFPLLLSAMPLHAPRHEPAGVTRNLFSDGGICSNFPIHFFDAWFPRHPTFGIDLVGDAGARPHLGDPERAEPPRWREVAGLGAFARQVKDAMQNWRDAAQSQLPGFRDRVCRVPLAAGEGGLNLRMSPEQISTLIARGAEAGRLLRDDFDSDRHRFVRYLTLMQLLQRNIGALGDPAAFADFADELAAGVPGVDVFRAGGLHDADWCRRAAAATTDLTGWRPEVDLDGEGKPQPVPDLRVVPPA